MRRVFIKIILIIGLPAGFSVLYYSKLAVYYESEPNLKIKMDYLYGSGSTPDILFLGSSRALNDIDPHIIDSICGTRSYNAGSEMVRIAEIRMLLGLCIEQDKIPRMLVVNIDPSSFQVDVPTYDFPDLLSYTDKDTVVYNRMAGIQDVYAYKWKYPFYRLQRLMSINDGFKVHALMKGKQAFRREIGSMDGTSPGMLHDNGFLALNGAYTETYMNPFNEKFQEKGFNLLQNIVDTCRRRRIRIVFITAPMYYIYRETFLNTTAILSRVSDLAKRDSVPYFNMIDDSLSMHKEDFFNFVHLNGRGAERFSLALAYLLKGMGVIGRHPSPTNH